MSDSELYDKLIDHLQVTALPTVGEMSEKFDVSPELIIQAVEFSVTMDLIVGYGQSGYGFYEIEDPSEYLVELS